MLVHTASRNIIFICYHFTDSTTHTLILDKRNLMVNKGLEARRNMMTIEDRADGVISDDKDKEKNNSDKSC